MDEASKRGKWTIRLSFKQLIFILPGLFYLANLIRMLVITSTPYFITLYTVGGMGIFTALFSKKYKLGNILLFFLLYGLTLIANWMMIGNISFNSVAVNVLLIGITMMMLVNQWTYREGVIIFFLTALIVTYALYTRTSLRILSSSNNYISVIMILAISFYYYAVEKDGRKLQLFDLLPALINFFVSVWARGRGGILSATVLLALMLFLYMRSLANKRAKRAIIIALIMLLACVILLITNINLFDAFMSLGKWNARGVDNTDRMYIWSSYFSKTRESIWYILFGTPLHEIPVITLFNGNCHNSFIQLHAYNGLLMLVAFMVMLVRTLIYYWRKQQFVKMAMLLVFVLRGMTDKFIFGQYGMPVMLFLVLYPMIDKQKKRARPYETGVEGNLGK